MQVATDIIIGTVYCGKHAPHSVELVEEWLRYGSILILSFFVLEWLLEVCTIRLATPDTQILYCQTDNSSARRCHVQTRYCRLT